MKATAKLSYRNNIPFGSPAFPFVHLEFYGPTSVTEILENEWNTVQENIRQEGNKELEQKVKNVIDLTTSVEYQKLKRPWYRFWMNEKEKEAQELLFKAKYKVNNHSIDYHELHLRAVEMLKNKGFVLIYTTTEGKACTTYINIFELNQ